MASSYTTGFSLEKIGSGEQSGAWGDTTNFNWDIVDRLASYKAVAITTNADTATLTVREASPGSGTENLQDGMYRMIKFTGALDSNCTVTIAPNTAPAYFIINNATTDSGSSGPYSVILTQGSGANITVENGKSAVVYCDGAGSGAAVVDAIANLALATIKTSGTITSGGTVAVTGNVTATGTVEPAGDTAAADNAAFGYTSVLGAIITGQGSTNDVTLVNDADATVLGIATGTTNVDIVGDVTASTVNADGDTSAGDNATMGYTAAEGLILTGQGSTNDVTIKNDADADVITIPTGATGVVLAGALTLGGAVAGADQTLARVNLKDYGEVTSALGSAGGARTVDLEDGNNFTATVSASTVTWTFSNPTASDELCGFTLFLTNGGSQTVNWPGSVDWAGGTAPTLTASGLDILVFVTTDGGTIWHGMVSSADSK
jgi:hypothetical protein